MAGLEGPVLVLVFAGIEALGLASAWLARIGEGSPRQGSFQRLFLGCLGVVGVAGILSLELPPGYWLSCGATLALMVLAATCDFHTTRCVTVW